MSARADKILVAACEKWRSEIIHTSCADASDFRGENRSSRDTLTASGETKDWDSRYNIAPTQLIPVIQQIHVRTATPFQGFGSSAVPEYDDLTLNQQLAGRFEEPRLDVFGKVPEDSVDAPERNAKLVRNSP